MSKIITLFIIIATIVILFLSLSDTKNMRVIELNNISHKPLNMEIGKYQDSDCGMIIDNLTYASQVISPDGKTWFFHDHGGMAHWLWDKSFKDKVFIWVMANDTKRWIDGKTAWYSKNDITPMQYGFGAYEHKKSDFIDFKTMQLLMLRGETMANPLIYKKLFGADNGNN